jgi:type I restriction enzyme M protein
MKRLNQELSARVTELADRYGSPLPEMSVRVVELESRVAKHLETMGFVP